MLREKGDGCPAQEEREFTFLFCLGPQSIGSSLRSLLLQLLISSGNVLTDIPGNSGLPAILASLSPVQLTHKINHPT